MQRHEEQALPRLELVTRAGCHLCQEMEQLLETVLAGRAACWIRRDVDAEPELKSRFSDVVPVLLRDGKPVAKVRVTRQQLERILRRRR